MQLCYSLFESPQYGGFDDKIKNIDVTRTLTPLLTVAIFLDLRKAFDVINNVDVKGYDFGDYCS